MRWLLGKTAAAVQPDGCPHLFPTFFRKKLVSGEGGIPLHHVEHGRSFRARSKSPGIIKIICVAQRLIPPGVRACAIGNDGLPIIRTRRIHSQWRKDSLLQKIRMRPLTDLLDDGCQQMITGITVTPLFARTELQGASDARSGTVPIRRLRREDVGA
jgi:hypothetical protein